MKSQFLPRLERINLRQVAFFIIVFAAAALQIPSALRPIDGSTSDAWREPDVGSIARNFYREDMNILYPRIDWRGDGPGYVESEFPLYPWVVAASYRVFGYHEELARLLSLAISLAGLMIFARLANLLLDGPAAVIAVALFAFNPLVAALATAVKPEPLMLTSSLLAVLYFVKWCRTKRRLHYLVALVATCLAILIKLPAAHIGIFLFLLCCHYFGWQALRRADLWVFAAIALLIPCLWYLHAHQLWTNYGNSLGISDEVYPRLFDVRAWVSSLGGVLRHEVGYVWSWPGTALGLVGFVVSLLYRRYREWAYWLVALVTYYVLTANTTGAGYAYYYHIATVPAAAGLMALGFLAPYQIWEPRIVPPWMKWMLAAAGVVLIVVGWQFELPGQVVLLAGGTLILACAILVIWPEVLSRDQKEVNSGRARPFLVVSVLSLSVLLAATSLINLRRAVLVSLQHRVEPIYGVALEFKKYVPPHSLIAVTAPSRISSGGMAQATNPPYFFFWMDRKGFALPQEEQSLSTLQRLIDRGVTHLILVPSDVRDETFEADVRDVHVVVEEFKEAVLVELRDTDR